MLKPWIDATLQTYQARGLVMRARHEMRRRLGVYERTVTRPAPATRLELLPLAVGAAEDFYRRHPEVAAEAVATADEILHGELRFFGGDVHSVGFPPDWHRHPLTKSEAPQTHWSHVRHDGGSGDIKFLWEPARFSFACTLARAFIASGQPRYREGFGAAFADFIAQNPPYAGVNWSCGQETAHRVVSVLFASSAFGVTTRVGEQRLIQFVYDSGRRIAAALDYALSQRNNHGLSELAGLWLCSQVCPDLPDAARWRDLVRIRLPRLLEDQFAKDGSYIQESLSYHRNALELLLLLAFSARAYRHPSLPGVEDALRRGTRYLGSFVDPTSGHLPNLGANDGSTLLPLGSSPRDVRGTLQHASTVTSGESAFASGPWDETSLWFGISPSPSSSLSPTRISIFPSGNAISRRGDSQLLLRAPDHHHHRPSHADSLHADLWYQGENLALDPGTYLYSGAPPWNNALCETRYHNTASVGTGSQMTRRGRFFWTHWNQASLELAHELPLGTILFGKTHADAARRFLHERLLVHTHAGAIILDRVSGPELEPLRIHWNLADGFTEVAPHTFQRGPTLARFAATPYGILRAVRACPDTPLGWHAPTYGQKYPCLAVELEVSARSACFFTQFSFRADPLWDRLGDDLWRRFQESDLATTRDEAENALTL